MNKRDSLLITISVFAIFLAFGIYIYKQNNAPVKKQVPASQEAQKQKTVEPQTQLAVFDLGTVSIHLRAQDIITELKKQNHWQETLATFEETARTGPQTIQMTDTPVFLTPYEFVIAALLEDTQKYKKLIDNKTSHQIMGYQTKPFSFVCGPTCGRGGREFVVNGASEPFFKVIDWIS